MSDTTPSTPDPSPPALECWTDGVSTAVAPTRERAVELIAEIVGADCVEAEGLRVMAPGEEVGYFDEEEGEVVTTAAALIARGEGFVCSGEL